MKLHDPLAAAGDPLAQSRHLLAALSASIPATVSFRGRWSSVAATAARLTVALDDLFSLPGAVSHPLAADLLISLPASLSTALALSRLCASPDPPPAKLRFQSDLAAAANALHLLTADAELLLRSAALLDSPTGIGSLHSLVTRLQMGTLDSRSAALDELAALLRESEKNAAIAAAQGVVSPLVRLLDSSCKGKAVAAIARISTVESCRHVLAAEGGVLINHLARVIECDDGSGASEDACVALQALTVARDGAMALGSRGGVAALITICQTGTPSSRAAAAGVLSNLAGVQELRENFLEDNAIPILISVILSSTSRAKENAVECLCSLTAEEEEYEHSHAIKHAILGNGGINSIKNYWVAGGELNLEPAIRLLRNLGNKMYFAEIILDAGFLHLAVSALASTASSSRTEAARLIAELAPVGRSRKELGETDCVRRLVGMLEAKAEEEQDAAVKTLASLMLCAGSSRRFTKEEKGIWNVVLLLDPLIRCVEKKYPVMVLQSVSQSRRCRKVMVAAGACGYLHKLVDMEVQGAKKLLDNLGREKLWGIIPRT